MHTIVSFGSMTERAVGVIMKEAVRRAIEVIQAQRFTFEAQDKVGYSGKLDDVVTSADNAAQTVYLDMLRTCFPTFGVVAEEDHLRVACSDPSLGDLYFTVDPLDGTKAFKRRQSHGVGTMLALVRDGAVLAAYVGDVFTREIYGFRPGGSSVYRINETGYAEPLPDDPEGTLAEQYALLRDRPSRYSAVVEAMTAHPAARKQRPGACRDLEITGGSIGVSMARLWKREVGLAVIGSSLATPWDNTPVVGISQKLGYVFLEPQNGVLVEVSPFIPTRVTKTNRELVVVHRKHLAELLSWQHRRVEG